MPEIFTERALLKTRQYECPSRGVESDYFNVNVAWNQWNEATSERRVKPSPVIGHPTPRPYVFRTWSTVAGSKVTTAPFSNYCGKPDYVWNHDCWRDEYRYYLRTSVPGPTSEPPDWALPLRVAIKGLRQNVGNYLVELRDTVDLFSDTAKLLRDAYRCLRRRESRSCNRLRKLISGGKVDRRAAEVLLMVDFGINPLLSDLAESIDRLNSRVVKPIFTRVSTTQTAKGSGSEDYIDETQNYYGWHQKAQWSWEVSDRAVAYIRILPGTSEEFTLGNPFEALYEATPFSFMVDWFIPLGDYLTALDAMTGIELVECTVTRRVLVNGNYSAVAPEGNLHKRGSFGHKSYKRSVENDVPAPSLPSFDPNVTWRKLLDAAAIARTTFDDNQRSPITRVGR